MTAFGGRVTSYGPIPLQDLPLLSPYTSLAESTIWRGKRIDPSGFYYMGARYYDPNAGRFISPDPLGHAASIDLYSAFAGDAVNNFDPDGRGGKGQARPWGNWVTSTATLANNAYFSISYGLTALTYGTDQADQVGMARTCRGLRTPLPGQRSWLTMCRRRPLMGQSVPLRRILPTTITAITCSNWWGRHPHFTGGNNQSTAYQIGYGTVTAATMLLGGETGEAGSLGEVSGGINYGALDSLWRTANGC